MKRLGAILALALAASPALLQGQEGEAQEGGTQEEGATGSQANLVFGVAGAFTTNSSLWAVPNQPLRLGPPPADTLSLTRVIDGGIGLMFYGMYFPKKSFGLSGEVFFLGTEYEDECQVAFTLTAPPADVHTLCGDIDARSRSTATVLATVGGVFRISPRGTISPYLRAAGGVAIINRSSVALEGRTSSGVVVIYDDDATRSVSPAAVLGLGFTARSKRGGYQVRLEARDNIIGYDAVTSAGPPTGARPPTEVSYKHLFSLVIGFEIVLEKSRGRRY